MAQEYPFYTEPSHVQGSVFNVSGNASRDTKTAFDEGRLKIDMVDYIALLEPTQAPLTTILTQPVQVPDGQGYKAVGVRKAPVVGNYEFSWLEDKYSSRFARVSSYAVSGDTTIGITAAGAEPAYIFTVGDVVMNIRTGEKFLVKTIGSSSTITVDSNGRGFGSTASATMVSGDGLMILGSANAENATARNANTTKVKKLSNFTQIFRDTIAISGTFVELDVYGGKDLEYQRRKKMTEHKLSIERAFLWGEKKELQTGSAGATALSTQGHSVRTTGGVFELIQSGDSFIQDQALNPLTAGDLNNFARLAFTYGKPKKMVMAGGLFLQAVNEIARGQIRTQVGVSKYGLSVSTWMTSFGELDIVYNPLFIQDYAGTALVLDMNDNCFRYRYIPNRDTQFLPNRQDPSMDGRVDEILTECGLERKEAPRHAMLTNIGS